MASAHRERDLVEANEKLVLASLDAQEVAAKHAAGFELFVSSVQDYAIFMLDPAGHVTTWNIGAERINGYAPAEILGRHFSVFYPGDDVENVCAQELSVAAAEGRFKVEGERVRRDGSRYWASIVITALRNEAGILVGFGKVTRDLTNQLRMEQERLSLQRAQEAERRKDEFLAIMSHELRNPLAPIATVVELLKLRRGQDCDKEIAILDRQVGHITRLVDDLLDASRFLAQPRPLSRKVVEVSELLRHALDVVAPMVSKKQQTLTLELRASGLQVAVDADRMAQVFDNLLTNAAKYTDTGGEITVRSFALDGRVQIEIEDTGMGIHPEFMPRLFELFTQGKRGMDRKIGGLGIGLAVAHRCVAEHGGELTAFSAGEGLGSRFSVRLPHAVSDQRQSPAMPLPRVGAKSFRVLVVDDNQDAAAMLNDLLQHLGHETRTAFDAPQALTLAAEFAPELVISDIGLPGMDGLELVRQLREMAVCAAIPIVALSGYSGDNDRERALQAGFSEHFPKPITLPQLSRMLGGGPM